MGLPEPHRSSTDSGSSVSTTSLVFEHIHEQNALRSHAQSLSQSEKPHKLETSYARDNDAEDGSPSDLENAAFLPGADVERGSAAGAPRPMDKYMRRALVIITLLLIASWGAGLLAFLSSAGSVGTDINPQDPVVTRRPESAGSSGSPVTLQDYLGGHFTAKFDHISWVAGPNGEDGLLLSQDVPGKDFLMVEDVTAVPGNDDEEEEKISVRQGVASAVRTLIKQKQFTFGGKTYTPFQTWPSPNHNKVLLATNREATWRHSFTALYWILDVATQTVEPLDPLRVDARVQLASWSPQSDAVVFTRDNNLFLRQVDATASQPPKKPHGPTQITKDGGADFFHGIPDWVYEEEVFGGNSATWWSSDGKFIAFLSTNESLVPDFPIDYFVSRPSGKSPAAGLDAYPEELRIKYPKAGAPNPVVDIQFYDVEKGDVFGVDIAGGFADDDRLITNVFWAGGDQLVMKLTNRVSDVLRVVLVDVAARTGKNTREVDVGKIDGGWFEISQKTKFVPADAANGRPDDGYIDTVIHDNYEHLAYFSPLDASDPVMLTSGDWEVVDAPSGVDLAHNLVYFVATKESSIQRHLYSVKLDGTAMGPVTNTSEEAFYSVSFSAGAGFALLTYQGPEIPWQTVRSTPANPHAYERLVSANAELASRVSKTAFPETRFGTLALDDDDKTELNYMELLPPNFDPSQKYPVLFFQYSGPGSQQVSKAFRVSFQTYVASSLGYVVVVVDGRGTGYIGRRARVVVRGHLGRYEAQDQIFAGRHWASLPYVDPSRLAIWGWSFGGFNTLKTLEADAGRTFSYGMAVAPVTDWRFYDSVYTERYMMLPSTNQAGYDESAVSNATALASNVRFLVMHGTGDDNVHFQNTLGLLDKLDEAAVSNYDVHVFPDSNHGIYLHNAFPMVYGKLSNWLVNAFNGEWLKIADAAPIDEGEGEKHRSRKRELLLDEYREMAARDVVVVDAME